MKNIIKLTSVVLLIVIIALGAVSCTEKVDTDALWENATYTSDTTLGSGANTVKVEISLGDKSVTLTVNTDKATLGEALYENGLVNDPTFFDTCNGMNIDFDKYQAYWGFYVDGSLALYGINDAEAATTSDAAYKIAYTK